MAAIWKTALSKNLQELRIVFCQQTGASAGIRDFVKNSYLELKKANPNFPILVREASNTEPRLIARYDFGVEKKVGVAGLSEKQVEEKIAELVRAGETLPRSTESLKL